MPNYCSNCGMKLDDPALAVCPGCGRVIAADAPSKGWLARLAGWLMGAPGSRTGRSGLAIKLGNKTVVLRDPKEFTARQIRSMDELPTELREQVQDALPSGVNVTLNTTVHQVYKFRDAAGHVQTYHSLDEMPPEVRAVFEKTMKGK